MKFIVWLLKWKTLLMFSPFITAIKGKGFKPMLSRTGSIIQRYGISDTKLDLALTNLSEILMEFDCKASLPVTATALSRHIHLAQKVQSKRIELAIHGYSHTDYTQLSLDQQKDHFQKAKKIFEIAGVKATGFRCPYLRWNSDTLTALRDCDFLYDSSQALAWEVANEFEFDAYQHVLSFYGANSANDYPSLPGLSNGLVRIPYCLPDDEALVERLEITDNAIMTDIWLSMLDKIYEKGELFTFGIHPERVPICYSAIRNVLKKTRSYFPPIWIASLDEIANWYRELGNTEFKSEIQPGGNLRISIHSPKNAVLLARSVNLTVPTRHWNNNYKQVLCNEIIIPQNVRPWIGLNPNRSENLEKFLRHQGYLVEISSNPSFYSYYFSQENFLPENERVILNELENGSKPLLRLSRWPEGSKAALALTGDVDAFTLWDYGLRLLNR